MKEAQKKGEHNRLKRKNHRNQRRNNKTQGKYKGERVDRFA